MKFISSLCPSHFQNLYSLLQSLGSLGVWSLERELESLPDTHVDASAPRDGLAFSKYFIGTSYVDWHHRHAQLNSHES